MKEFVEKLIERLEKLKEDAINEDCPIVPNSEDCEMEFSCASCYLNAAIKFVNELAEEYVPEINVGKWIPCSERLPDIIDYPKQKNRVLASYDDGIVRNTTIKSLISGEVEYNMNHKIINPIAWQPLPEPYHPEEQKQIPTDHYTERFNRVM